jgi:hypothetical protein
MASQVFRDGDKLSEDQINSLKSSAKKIMYKYEFNADLREVLKRSSQKAKEDQKAKEEKIEAPPLHEETEVARSSRTTNLMPIGRV